MEETRHCPTCKQKIKKLNRHSMDKQKVTALEILAKAAIEGHEWVKVEAGSGAIVNGKRVVGPYRMQAHVSRLTWFGLAEHGEHRSGLYRIKPDGFKFLIGQTSVPERIWCQDGAVVESAPERVTIHEVKHVIFDKPYWDNYASQQKYPDTGGLLF